LPDIFGKIFPKIFPFVPKTSGGLVTIMGTHDEMLPAPSSIPGQPPRSGKRLAVEALAKSAEVFVRFPPAPSALPAIAFTPTESLTNPAHRFVLLERHAQSQPLGDTREGIYLLSRVNARHCIRPHAGSHLPACNPAFIHTSLHAARYVRVATVACSTLEYPANSRMISFQPCEGFSTSPPSEPPPLLAAAVSFTLCIPSDAAASPKERVCPSLSSRQPHDFLHFA
jgi:hypothetical protein